MLSQKKKELELRDNELELIFGWAKELELEYIERNWPEHLIKVLDVSIDRF